MRVAAIQMNSGADVAANLANCRQYLAEAAADGCELAVLPENFSLMPVRGRDKRAHAEQAGDGPVQSFLAAAARELGLWIVAGSVPLVSPDERRVYGACPLVDPSGETRCIYRKMHLFDVDLPGDGESYRESRTMYPGDALCAADTPAGRLGLTICYDLRFPEMFRRLVDDGATLFSVPAAFTQTTGKAHWHILLRARAIENLAYVIAAGQTGEHPEGRATYGHSLIVDPWGTVLAEMNDGTGHIAADVDLAAQLTLRRQTPVLANRRL